jgi:hypothetical protein
MDTTPADKPSMKTVLYCRVSTADQTLEHQRVQAEASGYRFDEVVVDHGISGVRTARLLNRAAMSPTQDLGERLGSAFLQETGVPARLRTIIRDGEGTISLEGLHEWGIAPILPRPLAA